MLELAMMRRASTHQKTPIEGMLCNIRIHLCSRCSHSATVFGISRLLPASVSGGLRSMARYSRPVLGVVVETRVVNPHVYHPSMLHAGSSQGVEALPGYQQLLDKFQYTIGQVGSGRSSPPAEWSGLESAGAAASGKLVAGAAS